MDDPELYGGPDERGSFFLPGANRDPPPFNRATSAGLPTKQNGGTTPVAVFLLSEDGKGNAQAGILANTECLAVLGNSGDMNE